MAGLSSFSHITTQLASNAKSMLSIQSQIKTLATSKTIAIPPQLQQAYVQIRQGVDVMNDSRTMISAIIADSSGPLTAGSLATLTKHFDSNWDNFAKDANALYQNLSGGAQTNILETFAKSNFGDNVFYLGSAIKNELPGVFEGVSEFQKAVDVFGGSYRDPQQAAIKIRNGVVGIVNATEKVADSLNNMIKTYKGKGNTTGVAGNPLLDAIGNLHNNKALKTVTSTLAVGTDGMAAYGSTSRFLNDLKQGNLQGAISDGKQAIEDGKKVIDDIKNFDKGNYKGAAAKKTESPSETDSDEEEEKNDPNIEIAKSDSYVCSGATMRCTFGDKEAKLIVYPDRTVYLTGQPMANISDHTSLYNIQPFGKCRTTSFPSTGAATSANNGALTPMPCVPGTVCEWLQGKDDYIIKGKPALLKSSYCKCQWGGIITITDDGQTDTGPADLSRIPCLFLNADKFINIEITKEELLSEEGVNKENVDEVFRQIRKNRKKIANEFYVKYFLEPELEKRKVLFYLKNERNPSKAEEKKMLNTLNRDLASMVNGIDFCHKIEISTIKKGDILYQYNDGIYLGNYVTTIANTTPSKLGIAKSKYSGLSIGTIKKIKQEIIVNDGEYPCIQSTAKQIKDTWSLRIYHPQGRKIDEIGARYNKIPIETTGGGVQIFIPGDAWKENVSLRQISILNS